MTIDYDRLRELADEHTPGPWARHPDQPRALCNLGTKFLVHHEMVKNRGMEPSAEDVANTELIALAPDMARELLRLRDGLTELANEFGAKAEVAPNIPRKVAFIEANHALTYLLEGDTE